MERALAKTEFGFGQGGYQPGAFEVWTVIFLPRAVLWELPSLCLKTSFKTPHPRTRDTLCFEQAIFDDLTLAPKEQKVIEYMSLR
jgi:hypothetical protein